MDFILFYYRNRIKAELMLGKSIYIEKFYICDKN